MKCEHCNRERFLSVARTERFCTQRCVVNWLEDNPDKTPKDAVGDSDVLLSSLPSLISRAKSTDIKDSKSVPRALRNLQIDMASPGTTLHISSSSDSAEDFEDSDSEDEDEDVEEYKPDKPDIVSNSKKTYSTQPATIAAKRSVVPPQPPAIKKVKMASKARSVSPNQNSKSVKFNLGSTSISTLRIPPSVSTSQSSSAPGSISIVPLDMLSAFVKDQQKTFTHSAPITPVEVKVPKGQFTTLYYTLKYLYISFLTTKCSYSVTYYSVRIN